MRPSDASDSPWSPPPELILEAARVVIAERRPHPCAEAEQLLADAEAWGSGMCCPEAVLEYLQRRADTEANPKKACEAVILDITLKLLAARRSIDDGMAADVGARTSIRRERQVHSVSDTLAVLKAAEILAGAQPVAVDVPMPDTFDVVDGHRWDRLDEYFGAVSCRWAAYLESRGSR